MTATGFDALAAARDIEATGLERAQAEAIADAVRQAAAAGRDEPATKADLEASLANLETRLVRLVFAVAAGQAALIVGLLKPLP